MEHTKPYVLTDGFEAFEVRDMTEEQAAEENHGRVDGWIWYPIPDDEGTRQAERVRRERNCQ